MLAEIETPTISYIKTVNKFSAEEREHNIDKAFGYKYPDIKPFLQSLGDKEGIIIGGGPTVDKYVDKIKQMQGDGKVIFCIDRMYQWCHKHDITPDFVICMDASDDVTEGFKHINPKTKHILATQCKADVFELLKGYDNYVFCLPQGDINQVPYWDKHGYQDVTVVNAGGSITLGSMSIAMTFGIKRLHIFGFDCHIGDTWYADGIAGNGLQGETVDVKIDGRVFKTTSSYLSFMQQFFLLWQIGIVTKLIDDIRIYGDSMIKHASHVDIDGDK
jgi:hypothetical protein